MQFSHRFISLGFILSFVLVLFVPIPSWAVDCGDTIDPNEVAFLTQDLFCIGYSPALTLKENSLLKLGGHTVNCEDSLNAIGIQMDDLSATLLLGTVTNCRHAVNLDGTGHHLVTKVTATNSQSGFRILSDENELSNNTSKNNERGYFMPSGNRNTLKGNLARNNSGLGFLIAPAANAITLTRNRAIGNRAGFQIAGNEHKVSGNHAKNNEGIGFLFLGNDMKVHSNKAMSNAGSGFFFQSGSGLFVLDNIALKNQVHGIEFNIGAINSNILGNIALRNEEDDLFDGNFPDCDNNKWKLNRFKTRNQTCIR